MNSSIRGDGARLWNWFTSVQAAEGNRYESRSRSVQDSGWTVSFWFAVTSPLLGVVLVILALAIFCR